MYVNSKGFTLIELIAVIALLGIIGIIGISSYTSFYDAIQQKNIDNNIEIIKSSAMEYYSDTLETTFMVNDLLTNGYLKANENNSFYIDKEDYSCYTIHVQVTNKNIDNKNYEKVNINLGDKHLNNYGTCDTSDLEKNEITMKYDNTTQSVIINIPAGSTLTLISNLGDYTYKNNNNVDDTFSQKIELIENYPTLLSATIVDKDNNIYTKSIAIKKGD